jgi:ribosomal protein S18 acetylase RimI-like enzyme
MSRTDMRVGTIADADHVARVLALAFAADPVWGDWTFGPTTGPDRVAAGIRYWRPYVDAALKYDGVRVTGDGGAVALWVPPGVPEMDTDDEAALEQMLAEVLPDRADDLHEAYARFESSHPHDHPHWYLSLLATHPDHRGRGLGVALVQDQLDEVDAAHLPAYLESTNDANLERYGRLGFERHGSFGLPDGPTVTTMWRSAR